MLELWALSLVAHIGVAESKATSGVSLFKVDVDL